MDMYRDAGGQALVDRIMTEKHRQGTTLYTVIHHRETPDRIITGKVDVGPVWATEVIHARAQGLAVDLVEPGEEYDQRQKINYYVCRMNAARIRKMPIYSWRLSPDPRQHRYIKDSDFQPIVSRNLIYFFNVKTA